VTSEPFRLLLRVRYGECDAQGIVYNARWVEYVDVAASEYTRVLFGSVEAATTGIDWRLVKQTCEWHAPGRYDDVLDIRVHTVRVGTTSFALATELRRYATGETLVTVETIYVAFDPKTAAKQPIAAAHREALERGAPGVVVDQAAVS
jgi:acyl-CoA thioester hydrolase